MISSGQMVLYVVPFNNCQKAASFKYFVICEMCVCPCLALFLDMIHIDTDNQTVQVL